MTDRKVKQPRRKTVETYWAVRIGIPGRHHPYFMVRHERSQTPWLFQTQAEAEKHCPTQGPRCHAKVMKVKVST